MILKVTAKFQTDQEAEEALRILLKEDDATLMDASLEKVINYKQDPIPTQLLLGELSTTPTRTLDVYILRVKSVRIPNTLKMIEYLLSQPNITDISLKSSR
jgi:type IV secretory pathway ATPase VirB11/archaellum biosynthesis ATPase